MISRNVVPGVPVVALAVLLSCGGCGKSEPGDAAAGAGSGGAEVSGVEREAQEAAMAEVVKHWVKGPEAWTTKRVSGSPYAPDHYLRQLREITVTQVKPYPLSESDRLNGFEWAGEVAFKRAPCREAGDAGLLLEGLASTGLSVNRQPGQWTQWVDFQPEAMRVQKVKGAWQVHQDTWLLRGELPKPDDYTKAGVK